MLQYINLHIIYVVGQSLNFAYKARADGRIECAEANLGTSWYVEMEFIGSNEWPTTLYKKTITKILKTELKDSRWFKTMSFKNNLIIDRQRYTFFYVFRMSMFM